MAEEGIISPFAPEALGFVSQDLLRKILEQTTAKSAIVIVMDCTLPCEDATDPGTIDCGHFHRSHIASMGMNPALIPGALIQLADKAQMKPPKLEE